MVLHIDGSTHVGHLHQQAEGGLQKDAWNLPGHRTGDASKPPLTSVYVIWNLYLYMYRYTNNLHMYICMYVCMYACMHVCMYAPMYACMHAVHACIYVYIHVYLYTYTCIQAHIMPSFTVWFFQFRLRILHLPHVGSTGTVSTNPKQGPDESHFNLIVVYLDLDEPNPVSDWVLQRSLH